MSAVDFDALPRLEREMAKLRSELPKLIVDGVRQVLDQRDADRVGGLAALAEWIGAPTADAARKRVERDLDLAGLAFTNAGGMRRWRKSEVLGLLASRKAGR